MNFAKVKTRIITSGVTMLFAVSTVLINLIVVFSGTHSWMYKTEGLLAYPIDLVLGVLIITALSFFFANAKNLRGEKTATRFIKKACCVAYPLLFYWSCNYAFKTGWDVGIIDGTVSELLKSHWTSVGEWYSSYFSWYPNNIFLLWCTAVLRAVEAGFGLFNSSAFSRVELLITCCITIMTSYLMYRVLCILTSWRMALCGWLLCMTYIAISPWTIVFYSDSIGLIVPIGIFYLYLKEPKTSCAIKWKWPLLGFLSGIAYILKPQTFIVSIAIVLIHFSLESSRDKRIWISTIMCVIAFSVAIFIPSIQKKTLPLNIDAEQKFGLAHFFMMGLNSETDGVYSQDDVEFSKSFLTVSERTAADISRAKDRLEAYGLIGYIKHIRNKILVTYADGSFAWTREGEFWSEDYPKVNHFVSNRIRSIYCGSYLEVWRTYSQVFWLGLLFFSVFSIFDKSAYKNKVLVLQLSLFGLFLFELLFEARARYIYTYAPIYLILAMVGINSLLNITKFKYTKSEAIKNG